ncbi:MAG TPA: trehalase-like domain-containing protein, partial [Acidimicrobiia bacterium]|nr:trehalase-like domain-containing protein [Acidimicrobiia bacterium]
MADESCGTSTRTAPERVDGYASIDEYAAIGDGRTVALVARDGAIDWLCLPDVHSPSVFGALLDASRGGSFGVSPRVPFSATRRYVPDTNVLETTFATELGVVRLTDAMTLPSTGLAPLRELVRTVEGVTGTVPMQWRVEPRFDYGRRRARVRVHDGAVVMSAGRLAIGICAWDAGPPRVDQSSARAEFEVREGTQATIVLTASDQEPLVFPSRGDVARRVQHTIASWEHWSWNRAYEGPWGDEVMRSALALKLLVFAPSGATAAAPTTSLPETIGGVRNWDYRYCWMRDSAFIMDALLEI